jgi:hypothetical protein
MTTLRWPLATAEVGSSFVNLSIIFVCILLAQHASALRYLAHRYYNAHLSIWCVHARSTFEYCLVTVNSIDMHVCCSVYTIVYALDSVVVRTQRFAYAVRLSIVT